MMRAAILLLLAIMYTRESIAQSEQQALTDFKAAVDRSISQVIIPRYKPYVERESPEFFSRVTIRVENFADFNAYANARTSRVVLPVGLVVQTFFIIRAFLVIDDDPRLGRHLGPYVAYLADLNTKSRKAGYFNSNIQEFWQFAKVPRSTVARVMSTPSFAKIQEDMMVDSLAMILGHEIGHVVKKHAPTASISKAASRRQEAEADEYGRALARRAGFSTLPSLATIYVLFAALEGDSTDGTHPHPLCRIYTIGQAEFNELRREPGAIANVKRLGLDIDALEAQFNSFKQYC